jgi:hypothetical protein
MAEQFESNATSVPLMHNNLQREADATRFGAPIIRVEQTSRQIGPGGQLEPMAPVQVYPNPSTGRNMDRLDTDPRGSKDDPPPTLRPDEDSTMFEMRQGLWQQRQFQKPTDAEQKAEAAKRAKQQEQQQPRETGLQQAEKAYAEFQSAPDKQEALKRLESRFAGAVRQADLDMTQTMSTASQILRKIRPERDAVENEQLRTQYLLDQCMKFIPDEDKPFVNERMNALKNSNSDLGQQKILDEVGKRFPFLSEALKESAKADQDAATAAARDKQLVDGVQHKVEDQLQARGLYADALETAGDKTTADALRAQGMDKYVALFVAEARAERERLEETTRRMMPPPPVRPREFDIKFD